MKFLSRFSLILIILFFQVSCKEKEDDFVQDDDNNESYTQYGIPFEDIPFVDDIVMYEVNLRAFSSSGDLQGVINRLDQIKALGVNVIWLMPIHPIGEVNSVNSPYSVKDYLAVSDEYGTLDDLRELTDEAHAKGMAVIMDWIANHTAWDNSWISNPSWYTQDGSGNIVHPPGTNWLDVADLDYSNSDMRAAMIDAMKYWVLEANIDGYRCDYADGVPVNFWTQVIDTLNSIPNRKYVLLAEGSRYNHFTAGFDLIYGWGFYSKMKEVFNGQAASTLFTTHEEEYSNVSVGKHRLRFTTNHDESAWDSTPMVLFNGKEGALAASVVTIFMGGVPLLYTGQEVGRVSNVPFFSNSPINWSENPDMLIEYQNIMNVYTQFEVARKGTNTEFSNADIVCFKKNLSNDEFLVIVNLRNNSNNFVLPADLQNTNWINTLSDNELNFGTSIQLTNYQYYILRN
jgi:glycosidase